MLLLLLVIAVVVYSSAGDSFGKKPCVESEAQSIKKWQEDNWEGYWTIDVDLKMRG